MVVIGGGLAGASMACALAPTGLDVHVVEAVAAGAPAQPSFDERTVALAWGSARIFAAVGVWDRIAALEATPIRRIHVSDRGRPGMARLDATLMGVEALGYVVPARVLGTVLRAALTEHGNVTLHCPAEVESVEPQPEAVNVGIRADSGVTTLRARLAVLADGGRSPVREMLGMHPRESGYQQHAVVSTVEVTREAPGTAFERFTRTGPIALLPRGDGRYAAVWSLAPDQAAQVLSLDDAAFLAGFQDAFGDRVGRFVRVAPRRAYPLLLSRLDSPVHRRVAVVGNAAHTVHPVAGQGFNLGLRDVAHLAEIVWDASVRGEDPGAGPALGRYADRRRRDTRAVTTFTDGLVRIFSSEFLPLVAGRNAGLVMVDMLPPVKRALLKRTMGLAGSLPRLARGLPLTAPAAAGTRR